MEEARIIAAFNEWMRLFTEEPETFKHEFEAVAQFLKETADGKEPSYGHECAAFLIEVDKRLQLNEDRKGEL